MHKTPSDEIKQFHPSLWMIEDLEHSLNLVPDEAERYYALALIDVMLGQFPQSLKSLSMAVEANPKHIASLSLLGKIYFKLGEYERAAFTLEQVLNKEPDNITALTCLCMAYHCLDNKSKALAKQSLLQNIAPDLFVSLLNR
jgi:tetratricopeptide (TPR) repeat protein